MHYRQTPQEMGIMQWEKLARRDLNASPTSLYLIVHLGALCAEASCPFGIITDGQQSAVLNYSQCSLEDSAFSVEIVSTLVRVIIASFIHRVGRLSGLCSFSGLPSLVPCRGALFKSVQETAQTERCFRDFDLFTMQRSKDVYQKFCEWKHLLHSKTELLRPGALLGVKCNIMHIGQYEACSIIPWRSPYPNHTPPRETLDIVTRTRRPRHTDIDILLDTNPYTNFTITETIRTSRNAFSQVFLGHLDGSSRQICLKLFDERLFPMPEHPDYGDDSAESPEERLLDLNFADDMMCREEAVYNDRLRHLQGSMIPHCYGFHMVRINIVIILRSLTCHFSLLYQTNGKSMDF